MKPIVYSCPFVPPEWIAAHGLRPRRIQARKPASPHSSFSLRPSSFPPMGVCPYAHAFLAALSEENPQAVIFTTLCDQMRRAPETLEGTLPHFLLNLPATWQSAAARGLYGQELERLGRFLVQLGGHAPSPEKLCQTMLEYDKTRSALKNSAFRIPHSAFRIALLGGPLLADELSLFDLIEEKGGAVVLDGTETGERTLPASFDPQGARDDPLEELTRAYFDTIPDAARRPNTLLYEWLEREIPARRIQGLILVRHSWCDLWHAEVQRLKETLPVPVLDLDAGTGLDKSTSSRTATRIEAFLDLLK